MSSATLAHEITAWGDRSRDPETATAYASADLPTFERARYGSAPRNLDKIGAHLDSLETLLRETRAQYESGSLDGTRRGVKVLRHHLGLILRCLERRGHL